jgi:DNA-binding beta-propeller fold protein YncE
VALDRVNHRMFVPEPGNIRVLVYQLDEDGRHIRHTADHVIGHRTLLGRRRQSVTNRTDGAGGAETGLAVDSVHQRLFVRDRSRILVFDIHPERMQDYPEATHVIGQPDFDTMVQGGGRKKFSGAEIIVDERDQRLFVEDGSRILIFDIDPRRLTNYPDATLVIGQPNFNSREQGLGPNRLTRAHGIALDSEEQRLFVSDQGNNRILVFDVHPNRLRNDPRAIAVLGQPDFFTNAARFTGAQTRPEARYGLRSITPGGLDYDSLHKRLFVSQLPNNRILVFEAAPDKLQDNLEAFAVVGQPDFSTFDPVVSQTQFAFPKDPSVDSEKQMLYVSEGFPGGNRVMAFDIRPEVLRSGLAAIDVIGHVDDDGRDDFDRRMANDRLDGRTTTLARAVALDSRHHRLWVADEYNNRVLGFQLDRDNRVFDREARWVFGQPDFRTARADRSVSGMNVPLAVAYDEMDERLYVGDGWNDRVLIYDVDPTRLLVGGNHSAATVLGQPDFEVQEFGVARDRFDFGVDIGRGIASSMLPVGIALDVARRRAFISDGGNHRILVFDIHRERLESGASAIAVIGQPNFSMKEPRLAADGLNSPGHLAYDGNHDRLFAVDNRNHRVVVFNVAPARMKNGMSAERVIGQPDFTTTTPAAEQRGDGEIINEKRFVSPNGVAYDSVRDRLYVADQGNDRVMVFDVAPDQFVNHPSAVAVLGQANTWSQSNQVLRDVSAQDQLYDPRGLAFDSVNQRLYATDSHWARLMVFTFPESHYAVSSPSHGVMGFSSLDPVLALRPSQRVSGYGIVREASSVLWKRTKSQVMMEAQTEQQSRMLISQTVARVAAPTTRALMFIDHRDGTRAMVAVINPTNVAQRVQFSFRQGSDSVSALRIIPPGERLTLDVSEAVGASVGAWLGIGALDVESEVPLSVVGWSVANTRHGDALVTVLPVVRGVPANPVTVLPNVTIGGGYRTDVILLNPHDESVQGEVSVRDETGQEIERERYLLEPRSSFVWRPSGDGLIVRTRYVVVYPHSPSTPSVAALVSRWEEGLITMGAIEPVSSILQARVPVDTMPDLIRHGRRTQFHLVIANASDHGASVRLILRDLDGKEIDRVERLILAGAQTDFTLGELFDRVQFSGSLSLGSDVPVAVTARQLTTNLRGDEILTEIPVLTDSAKEATQLFPYTDGAGDSTQVVVLAGPMALVDSSIDFLGVDGRPLDVILR